MSTAESPELLQTHDAEADLTLPCAETAGLRAQYDVRIAQESERGLTCPNCGTEHRKGELVCVNCGVLFANGGKTDKLNTKDSVFAQAKQWPKGEVFAEDDRRIYLQINNQCIDLPVKDAVVLGRTSSQSDDSQPDIALNEFGAAEQGVSRQHARITRHGNVIYITDMGSSNGTFLNGRPLLRNHNRILRSGDELQLGFLKLYIRF